jgi:hypothetical protein
VTLTLQTPTTLTYTGPGRVINGSPAGLSARLATFAGDAVAGRAVRFDLGAGVNVQSCSGTTDSAGTARCTIDRVDQPVAASVGLRISFTGGDGLSASSTAATLVLQTPTTTVYTGPGRIANGMATQLTASLLDFRGDPVVGRAVRFDLGSGAGVQSCTGTADAAGTARCAINPVDQPLNAAATVPLAAAFAGDQLYLPSSASAQLLLEFYTGRGYGLSAAVTLLLPPPVRLAPQPDTGQIRTAHASATTTPCTATISALVITARALCPRVTTSLNPGTSTATATVDQATIGLPGVPVIDVRGLTATSTSRCSGASGNTRLTLTLGGTPITVPTAPNSRIDLPGGGQLIINEQAPVTGADHGLTVNAVHVVLPGNLADIVLGSATSAVHNCVL